MLLFTATFGGLLLMMGNHSRSESLFYYFRLEDQVPENHLLRLIDRHVNFDFVRAKLKDSYSDAGRPSIDPELLLRILLIGYLYGITSERKLVEELRMHLAWRWFTGLGFNEEIPHHSTFSKNRHGRFQESKLFEQLFEEIVKTVCGSGTGAGQAPVSGWQLCGGECSQGEPHSAGAINRSGTGQPYGATVSGGTGNTEPGRGTGASARPGVDHGSGFHLCDQGWHTSPVGILRQLFSGQYSCVIVGVQATAARMSQETVAAQEMLTRFARWQGREPVSMAADTTYGNGEFLQWLAEREITPYMRTRDSVHRKNSPFVRTPVAVEKLGLPENQPKRSDQKCIGDRRKSFIGHMKSGGVFSPASGTSFERT
jgi:transposase